LGGVGLHYFKPGCKLVYMETIGTFEGKTHFARLMREAAGGKVFLITKNGKPVARLGPAKESSLTPSEAIKRMLARHVSLGMSIEEALKADHRE
jgi:prevent-host-death family protein